MVDVDRRAVFVAGLAATSFISNTTASAQQAAAVSPEARLRELGIELPRVTPPVANYVPSARLGNIIFLAGAGPLNPDGSRPQGKVGRDVTLEQANKHARNVGLQLLAALREAAGSLDKVVRFGRVFGMVNAAPEFTDHRHQRLLGPVRRDIRRPRSACALRRRNELAPLQYDGGNRSDC
jgi:enamine deaminase RidA (YjgF/YER057c/UK114 family)